MPWSKDFAEQVHAAVRQIPAGETRTYGEVAAAIGRPGAARAVGTVMRRTTDPSVPCYRVVHADGNPGYPGAEEALARERNAAH